MWAVSPSCNPEVVGSKPGLCQVWDNYLSSRDARYIGINVSISVNAVQFIGHILEYRIGLTSKTGPRLMSDIDFPLFDFVFLLCKGNG